MKVKLIGNVIWVVTIVFFAIVITGVFSGCGLVASDAAVARHNLEVEEQNFNVVRRVVFYNGITDKYILVIEGRVAITVDTDGDLVVTVKTDSGKYLKHYLGLSDNVTYFSEALEGVDVSTARYKVIFKPSTIVPDIDLKQ
jgi:hypothetical protein